MTETSVQPESGAALREAFQFWRRNRAKVKSASKTPGARRSALSHSARARVLAKTHGRCHICGGAITGPWQADHVLAHSGGGVHAEDNYLPAHALCNNYRWDYSSDEFQFILKLGVWLKTQIERNTTLGRACAEAFVSHETRRRRRRVGSSAT